jgi:hypothetical protein
VCIALYPYTAGFPVERVKRTTKEELEAQLERFSSIADIATTISPGDGPEVVTTVTFTPAGVPGGRPGSIPPSTW